MSFGWMLFSLINFYVIGAIFGLPPYGFLVCFAGYVLSKSALRD